MKWIDLHAHAGPSVMPRAVDAAQMLLEAGQAGYAAVVIKDHYFPTMMSAKIAEDHLDSKGCRAFGGIALNNSVGGINLKAVDAACALGAKFVWMPTVSSLRHKIMHSGHGLAFPGSKGMSVAEEPIMYLDDNGELKPEVIAVLDYLAGKPEVILATGHGSRDEIDKLVRAAATRGVQRIMINHPHYMIGASLEDMVAWSRLGAYIELNAVAFVPDSKFYSNKIEEAGAIIESVGLDKIVVDSDYGQNGNGSPVTGMQRFVALLQEHCGLSEADVEQICYKKPCHLLSIDAE